MISVIIPAYNSEKTIVRALDSIKNQEGNYDFEIIIVNDGSTDNTLAQIEEYCNNNPHQNIKIISKENGGVSSARNVGLSCSSGEYIALLDSDDEWMPEKTKHQIEFLTNNPNVNFVGTNIQGRKPRLGLKIICKPSIIRINDILITMTPQTSTVIIKKSVFEKVGNYDESLSHGEDGDLWLRIISNYESWLLPEGLVIFDNGKRGFGESGLSRNLKKMQEGVRRLNKRAYDLNLINRPQYLFIKIYNELKYIRRKLIKSML